MHHIFYLMGKSASGKDTIYQKLLEHDTLGLAHIVLYTTRPIREGEVEGREYYFTDEAKLRSLQESGHLIELRSYNTVHGMWHYFTADDGQIDLASGKRYIVIGTLEAYDKFCEYYGNEHIMPIYIEVDDGIRLERALERERRQQAPDYEEMCRRFIADCHDFSEENIAECNINKRYSNNAAIGQCLSEIRRDIGNMMIN